MLDVGSPTTALNDYTTKRDGYAAFGIPEYWRFDPTGGERYPTGLAGDRLVEGAYQPMSIVQVDSDNFWGHSDVLNLDLCWELGRLRWWDPVAQRYLTTYDEEADRRIAGQVALSSEREALSAEREARLAAEARVRELEEELRRRT